VALSEVPHVFVYESVFEMDVDRAGWSLVKLLVDEVQWYFFLVL